jgi:hypothetical protein
MGAAIPDNKDALVTPNRRAVRVSDKQWSTNGYNPAVNANRAISATMPMRISTSCHEFIAKYIDQWHR